MLAPFLIRTLILLLITSLALPLAEAGQTVDAKKKNKTRTKTVTEIFTNGGTITIPDAGTANPFPSTIQVGGLKKGEILDVNLTLTNINHPTPNDVEAMVVAPSGKAAYFMGGAGGANDAVNITLTFDDDAGALLPDTGALSSGTFRPSLFDFPSETPAPYRALSAFNGDNPNGTWQLFVFDDVAVDAGNIASGWSLEIRAKVEEKKKKKKKK